MSATVWIVLTLAAWLVVMGAVFVSARALKDADRAQTNVLAGERLARFTNPRPLRNVRKPGRRTTARERVERARTYVGG